MCASDMKYGHCVQERKAAFGFQYASEVLTFRLNWTQVLQKLASGGSGKLLSSLREGYKLCIANIFKFKKITKFQVYQTLLGTCGNECQQIQIPKEPLASEICSHLWKDDKEEWCIGQDWTTPSVLHTIEKQCLKAVKINIHCIF